MWFLNKSDNCLETGYATPQSARLKIIVIQSHVDKNIILVRLIAPKNII